MSGPIHVVLAFDDNFWAPAYATMRGICLSSRRRSEITFHLLHLELDPGHRKALEAITTEFGAQLDFIALHEREEFRAMAARLPEVRGGTRPIVYARLMIDLLLPAEVTRFVFADCDMLFKAPVEFLVDLDLGEKSIAAVPDIYGLRFMGKRDLKQNRELFDTADPYFNAGLMVVDRQAWRRADPLAMLDRLIETDRLRRLYHDQDVLNLTFKNDWLILDSRWNYIDPTGSAQSLNPHVLHYTGKRKPWLPRAPVAFARLYRRVMTRPVYDQYRRERRARNWRRFGRRLMVWR